MNIVVLCKQVFDTEAKIQLKDGKIDESNTLYILNPYDEFGVEEALKIKEAQGGEVIVLSLGPTNPDAIRQALAMGADRAISVEDPALAGADASGVAKALAKALDGVQYDLILGGMVAIDDNAYQGSSRLAEVLNIPQVNAVQKLTIADGVATCERQAEGATEIIEVKLPAIITATKGLNEPRYPSLKGIMQSKKKELKVLSLSDLGLSADDVKPLTSIGEYSLPAPRKAGKKLQGETADTVAELINLLRNEAKVI